MGSVTKAHARTDVHRPTTLVTEDYEYVACFHRKSCADTPPWKLIMVHAVPTFIKDPDAKPRPWDVEVLGQTYTETAYTWLAAAARVYYRLLHNSTTTRYGTGNQCDHCGAHIDYVAILFHKPTGDYLAVGEICLDNRFSRATHDFQSARKAAQLDREQHRIRTAFEAFLTDHADVDWTGLYASTNPFIQDVLGKFRTYGGMSDRQLEAIKKALAREQERAQERAGEAELPPPPPVVEGRQVIEGTVVSVKEQHDPDDRFRPVLRIVMTVKDAERRCYWGTVPASLDWHIEFADGGTGWHSSDAERVEVPRVTVGDAVRFTGTVTKSDKDEAFGFYKRPAKAEVLKRAQVAS